MKKQNLLFTTDKGIKKQARRVTAFVLSVLLLLVVTAIPALAASGSVYTCTINRLYQHPVTGQIEDSGGEESYSIGQGMVEGCVYPTGILEVTDSGEYYLTIRMSLMDFTSGHTFQVQNWGDSAWSMPSQGITGTGSDSNGTTADICIQVPSENCIVRGTMYVEPMGRDVVWYMYPDNFSAGNSTDMNATMVTEASGSGQEEDSQQQEAQEQNQQSQQSEQAQPSEQIQLPAQQAQEPTAAAPQPSALTPADDSTQAESSSEKETTTAAAAISLNNTPKEVATPAAADNTGNLPSESGIEKAQGLSLSTAVSDAVTDDAQAVAATGPQTAGSQILVNTLSVIIPGLILIAAGAFAVYFLRKNWHKWGHAPDDDE